MADAKTWHRTPTSADNGFMHDESMDSLVPDIYNRIAEAGTIEDQTRYLHCLFHGPDYADKLNMEFFRPIVRSERSLGTTNYLTESESHNKAVTGKSWEIMSDFLARIIAHRNCYDEVIAVLAWNLVSTGVSNTLPDTLAVDVDEDLAKYILHFEERAAGSENTDKWTTHVQKYINKWEIAELMQCSNRKVSDAEWYLRQICSELFSEYLDKDTDISEYAGW